MGRPVIGGTGAGSMGLGRSFGSVEEDGRETASAAFSLFKREDRLSDAAAVLGLTGTLGARLIIAGEPLGFMPVVLIAGEDWVCAGLGGWERGIIG